MVARMRTRPHGLVTNRLLRKVGARNVSAAASVRRTALRALVGRVRLRRVCFAIARARGAQLCFAMFYTKQPTALGGRLGPGRAAARCAAASRHPPNNDVTRGGTRTHNFLLRREAPYPLGHTGVATDCSVAPGRHANASASSPKLGWPDTRKPAPAAGNNSSIAAIANRMPPVRFSRRRQHRWSKSATQPRNACKLTITGC